MHPGEQRVNSPLHGIYIPVRRVLEDKVSLRRAQKGEPFRLNAIVLTPKTANQMQHPTAQVLRENL